MCRALSPPSAQADANSGTAETVTGIASTGGTTQTLVSPSILPATGSATVQVARSPGPCPTSTATPRLPSTGDEPGVDGIDCALGGPSTHRPQPGKSGGRRPGRPSRVRGQPRFGPPRPGLSFVLPEGPTEERSGGDRLKAAPPGWRDHIKPAGAQVRDRIKVRRSPVAKALRSPPSAARKGNRGGRPEGRDRHPGVGTPPGRRRLTARQPPTRRVSSG
jgi:hypothetical protein